MGAPPRCQPCPECNSTLASYPEGHREPQPHDFTLVQEVRTDQGVCTVTHCNLCYRRRDEIEKEQP